MSDYICKEIVVEILTKLPPKSLLRFRTLSKSLGSCISSRDFIRKHAFQSPLKFLIRHRLCPDYKDFYTVHPEDKLPFRQEGGYNEETALEFPYRTDYKIVGTCNGIICVYEYGNDFILWNPSIRRKLYTPDVLLYKSLYTDGHWVAAGFCFDSVADDYKIVLISYCEGRLPPECSYVYSMKTDSWSEIAMPTSLFSDLSSNAYFVNGTLHWLAECSLNRSDNVDRHYILTYDLSTQTFGTIVLPKPVWRTNQLAVIKGSLAVISSEDTNFAVWVRRDYNNAADASWLEIYKSDNVPYRRDKIFELPGNATFLFQTFYTTPRVYNIETHELRVIKEFNECSPTVDIEKYVESLELLGRGKGTIFYQKVEEKENNLDLD